MKLVSASNMMKLIELLWLQNINLAIFLLPQIVVPTKQIGSPFIIREDELNLFV